MCLGRRLYLGNKLRIHPLQPLPLYGAHLPSDGFISFIFLFRRCSSGCVHMLAAAGPTAKLFTERPLVASDARRVADVCCVTACWGIFAICECAVRLELLGSNSVRADQPEQRVLLPGWYSILNYDMANMSKYMLTRNTKHALICMDLMLDHDLGAGENSCSVSQV
jgi:hypothetical protein